MAFGAFLKFFIIFQIFHTFIYLSYKICNIFIFFLIFEFSNIHINGETTEENLCKPITGFNIICQHFSVPVSSISPLLLLLFCWSKNPRHLIMLPNTPGYTQQIRTFSKWPHYHFYTYGKIRNLFGLCLWFLTQNWNSVWNLKFPEWSVSFIIHKMPLFPFLSSYYCCAGGTLWHLQKFSQYIIDEFNPPSFSFFSPSHS
jgi:hypothetical protein